MAISMDAAAMGRSGVPMVLQSLAFSGLWEQTIVSQRRIVASVAKRAKRLVTSLRLELKSMWGALPPTKSASRLLNAWCVSPVLETKVRERIPTIQRRGTGFA
jgi:hypothetical protein